MSKKHGNKRLEQARFSFVSRYRNLFLTGAIGISALVALLCIVHWAASRPKVAALAATTTSNSTGLFLPTVVNSSLAPSHAPLGMVWIPGGEFSMGAMDPPASTEAAMHGAVDARPIHRVYVNGFYMDKTDVTNAEFAKFAEATVM